MGDRLLHVVPADDVAQHLQIVDHRGLAVVSVIRSFVALKIAVDVIGKFRVGLHGVIGLL